MAVQISIDQESVTVWKTRYVRELLDMIKKTTKPLSTPLFQTYEWGSQEIVQGIMNMNTGIIIVQLLNIIPLLHVLYYCYLL